MNELFNYGFECQSNSGIIRYLPVVLKVKMGEFPIGSKFELNISAGTLTLHRNNVSVKFDLEIKVK